MRFLHAADIHLGYRQYNSEERAEDFYRAFRKVADLAIQETVQACVIAGDLFDKCMIEPVTLLQAEKCLNRMQKAGIRVLAVAGNHDRARRDQGSWLGYLDARGLITLLKPPFGDESCLVPGVSYVDWDGVRFIGVPWLGASTATALARIAGDLAALDWDGIRYTVLIAHAALEGQLPNVAGYVRFTELEPLRERVDYVAFGHLHKPYSSKGWIFNPGAIENCKFDEAGYGEKGVYLVEIDAEGKANAELHPIPGRPFRTLDFSVDLFSNPDELREGLRAQIRHKRADLETDPRAVIHLLLNGNLSFSPVALDLEDLRRIVQDEVDCLLVRLNSSIRSLNVDVDFDDDLSPETLERQVFEDIARADTRYSGDAGGWGELMQVVKRDVLGGAPAEGIYSALDDHMTGRE